MNDVLFATLTPEAAALWAEYLSLEANERRPQALTTLRKFLLALQAAPQKSLDGFAEAFCAMTSDEGEKIPLRQPLFASVIGPYLVEAYQHRNLAAPRWIAWFFDSFLRMPDYQRFVGLPPMSEAGFLREALAHDPTSSLVRKRLIDRMTIEFDYAIHELPAGVLWNADGATIEESLFLLRELDELRELVAAQGEEELYREKIAEWDFHFRGYADYQTRRSEYEDYAEYIERNQG